MKHVVATALVIALVVDIVLFAGVGVGVGALAVSQIGQPVGANYHPGYYNVSSGTLAFGVTFINVASGSPLITSEEAGQSSTDLVWAATLNSGSNCGNGGDPTFVPATQGASNDKSIDYGRYVVNFGEKDVSGTINGVSFTTTNGSWTVPESPDVQGWCVYTGIHNAVWTPTGYFWNETLILLGSYSTMKVAVSLEVGGQYCSGTSGGTAHGACLYLQGHANHCPGCGYVSNNGAWNGVATASANYQSAGASFSFVGQPFVNGGTLGVSINTGYDDGYYNLSILCPQPRSCGGSADPEFSPNPVHVPDFQTGFLVNWRIPTGAAQANSNPLWNEWVVQLTTGFVSQQVSLTTIINPTLAPGVPSVTFSDSSGQLYPGVGDTVTLSIAATGTNASGPILSFVLAVYYLAQGSAGSSAPACGSGWVTGNCPNGQTIVAASSGLSASATYTFKVNPPAGYTAGIGYSIFSQATSGFSSAVAYGSINIRPAGCVPGQPCDPNNSGIGLWQWLGPITLLLIPILVLLLAVVLIPEKRIQIVCLGAIVVLVVVAAIFWGDFQSAFTQGGIFGAGQAPA